jgi:hypothetical protein
MSYESARVANREMIVTLHWCEKSRAARDRLLTGFDFVVPPQPDGHAGRGDGHKL